LHRQLTVTGEVSARSEQVGNELVRVYEFSIKGPRIVREAMLATVFADGTGDKKLAELRVHISATGATRENIDTLWKYLVTVQRQR
jgi:hypothetical protein